MRRTSGRQEMKGTSTTRHQGARVQSGSAAGPYPWWNAAASAGRVDRMRMSSHASTATSSAVSVTMSHQPASRLGARSVSVAPATSHHTPRIGNSLIHHVSTNCTENGVLWRGTEGCTAKRAYEEENQARV